MLFAPMFAATIAGSKANLIAGLVFVSVLFLRRVIIEILGGRDR